MDGHVISMREIKNAYKILIVKREDMRPLGRARHRWEDNIKMDLTKTKLEKCVLGSSGSL
jgi:hypothetical protein